MPSYDYSVITLTLKQLQQYSGEDEQNKNEDEYEWTTDTDDDDPEFKCDGCWRLISNTENRFHCQTCIDYDLVRYLSSMQHQHTITTMARASLSLNLQSIYNRLPKKQFDHTGGWSNSSTAFCDCTKRLAFSTKRGKSSEFLSKSIHFCIISKSLRPSPASRLSPVPGMFPVPHL